METQPHVHIWLEPGTKWGDLLDQILAENRITTASIIAGMHDIENGLFTPEFIQAQRDSGNYFECTPEWREEATRRRQEWHRANP